MKFEKIYNSKINNGCVIWITGLSGAGKTTLSKNLLFNDKSINVKSTLDFKDQGFLKIKNEIIFYNKKTENTFENIKRNVFISSKELNEVKKKFLGITNQTPPIFSAIKKDGKRLYEYARNNEKVLIPKREIEIRKLDLDIQNFPEIKFMVECTKGTYIRSLVHDIGISLKSGAHLTSLCREKIGEYSLKDAMSIDYFEKILNCSI